MVKLSERAKQSVEQSSNYTRDILDFNHAKPQKPFRVVEQKEQQDHTSLLQEISKLFEDLGETTNSAKRYWLGVWLQNKGYDPELSGKNMSKKQLLELKADIEEVLRF